MTIYFSIYIPESFTQYLYADNHATNGSFVLLFLCTRKKYMCLSEGEKADIEILLMFLSVNSIPLTFHLYASKLGYNSLLLCESIDDFYSWIARVMRGVSG